LLASASSRRRVVFDDCLLHWSSTIVNCRVDDPDSGAPLGRGGGGGGEEGDGGQEAVGHQEAEVAHREMEAAVSRGQEVEVPTRQLAGERETTAAAAAASAAATVMATENAAPPHPPPSRGLATMITTTPTNDHAAGDAAAGGFGVVDEGDDIRWRTQT